MRIRFDGGRRAAVLLVSVGLLAGPLAVDQAQAAKQIPTGGEQVAQQQATAPAAAAQAEPPPAEVPPKDRDRLLGPGWRSSRDRAWTTTGDAFGFHVLVADERSGYAWRNAATLVEPGFEADQWIGRACVTGSGRRAVVVYAPRTFTNKAELFSRGGFTAVVDLQDGTVRKLPVQTSLAYYNPGCGAGESAVLTQSGGENLPGTRLLRLDAAKARLSAPIRLQGQVTSAVPLADGAIAAADGARVIRVTARGARTQLSAARSVPFELTADRDGGVTFLDRAGDTSYVRRVSGRTPAPAATLASGRLTDVGLTATADRRVFITGGAKLGAGLPAAVRQLRVASDARVSTTGRATVLTTRWADGKDSRITEAEAVAPRPVTIDLRVAGGTSRFLLDPTLRSGSHRAQGLASSPKAATGTAGKAVTKAAAGSPTNPVEAERTCSVPRNDPRNQAMQPKPRQVEWAVDQAITGNLNAKISRAANWKNLGMPAYQPQTLFPSGTLASTGRAPAQVVLGIAAQESNLWQASRVAVPGVTSNPLIGNFYGRNKDNQEGTSDDWIVDFSKSDCGYGIMQITDKMRLGDAGIDYQAQRAVALDYTVNIAAGLKILYEKWNQTRAAGMIVNNGDAAKLENWFFAAWAYNSGFYPETTKATYNGAWGVGWLNNPVNPEYPANRTAFMDVTYADAAHPGDWPYPEKVMGFAGHPPELLEAPNTTVAGFRAAWWNGDGTAGVTNRQRVKPPVNQFCDTTNNCFPGQLNTPTDPAVAGSPAGPCAHKNASGQFDLRCWYNKPTTWKSDCSYSCGNELLRFNSTYAEEADGTAYLPNCSLTGLPSGALVIDDVPDGTPSVRPNCGRPWTNAGTFAFDFPADPMGNYPAKIDLHQIGGGFGGHFYFGHSRTSGAESGKLRVTGTWRLSATQNRWMRVMVHLPDHGAHTQQAAYKIDTGNGTFSRTRYVNQKRLANNWVSIGAYSMSGVPRVQLSTVTDDGSGDEDVAFDAVAFQPLPGKPKHLVAVLGDSYTSGEGVGNYYAETDVDHGTSRWNACRRSRDSWPRRVVLPGTTNNIATKADNWDTDLDLGFVACSGAQTQNVWDAPFGTNNQPYREGQFNEQKQVRSGVLSTDTTLVMLTLGGNDGNGFSSAMQACGGLSDCSLDSTFLPKYKGKVDTMIPNLRYTLQDIAAKAPNARIVLMGYPELLSRTVKCAGSWYYDGTEVTALATLVNYADDEQKKMVDALRTGTPSVKVDYANPVADFVGHGGCDSVEWINKFVNGPNGDGDFFEGDAATAATGNCPAAWFPGTVTCLSRSSFHPKAAGTGDPGYAGVMRKRLAAIGYTGSP